MQGDDMANGSTATFKVSVLRCRKTGRVLFLEAGKDFVDTLFSFLLLLVATILHMALSNSGGQITGLGGASCIYKSVEKLDSSFMNVDKKSLLQPRPAFAGACGSTGLLQGVEAAKMKRPTVDMIEFPSEYYRCDSGNKPYYISRTMGTNCCSSSYRTTKMGVLCGDIQSIKESIIRSLVDKLEPVEEATCGSTGNQGFVRENITYMVTDSLEVMPSTTIRSIKVLNTLKVATLADLESTDSIVGITQCSDPAVAAIGTDILQLPERCFWEEMMCEPANFSGAYS